MGQAQCELIGWLFLFVMSPHAENFDRVFALNDPLCQASCRFYHRVEASQNEYKIHP